MKTELHDYDIYPKVVVSERTTQITVKPLGWHAAFPDKCRLAVCPLDEGNPVHFPARRNAFCYDVAPDADGCLRFSFQFFGEQEFFIRITAENGFKLQLCVFSVGEDLAGRYPFRGDLHVHTRSSGGLEAPEIVCANFRKKGYDFIAVTDHNRYFPSLNAMAAYRDVPPEMTIVPGEEVHLPSDPAGGHINDIHIINFGGDYSINALISDDDYCEENAANPRAVIDNPPPRMTTREYFAMVDEYAKTLAVPEDIETFAYAACHWIFREIHRANGLGIFCHPYWIANVFHIPPQFVDYMMETRPFDAFEVLGGELYYEQNGFQTIQYYEDRMKGRTYPVVGSADSHASVNHPKAHICSTLVFAPENRRDALVASVREGYAVAVDSISTEPRYVGELRLVRYACFLEKEFFPLHDMLCFEEGRAMKDYVCGVAGGKETLAFLHGRMREQREKYFAFDR